MRNYSGMLDGTFTAPSTITQHQTHNSAGHQAFVAHVIVSAISGAGATATLVLEDSPDGQNWAQIATQSVTATGTYALRSGAGPVGEFVRVRLSTLAGTTPSVTMATKGAAR